MDEWPKLAEWAHNFKVESKHMSFLIQVPRAYKALATSNHLNNFQEMLDNIFLPIFEATSNPEQHQEIVNFLTKITGFDVVDDEFDEDNLEILTHPPQEFVEAENPTYEYFCYHIWQNVAKINQMRLKNNQNSFKFRPHSGETGPLSHLACSFLLSQNINHGTMLMDSPVLEYLYYLAQIGVGK